MIGTTAARPVNIMSTDLPRTVTDNQLVRGLLSRPVSERLLIVLAAAILCLPCLIRGVPPFGDSITHTVYQRDFSQQFWQGDYYPRWLKAANKGYGSPIFLVQYPLPYWVTALLRPVLRFAPVPNREAHELGVFCFLAIAAAGLAVHYWLRIRFTPFAATATAITYICLPNILGADLYGGVEIGQLSAFVWMPLALGICDCPRMRLKRTCMLGVVLALLIMSNIISAALFVPLLLAYAVACSDSGGIIRRALPIIEAFSLGAGIAGIYVLPLLAYRRLFDLGVILRIVPSFSLSNNFLFVAHGGLRRGLVIPLLLALFVSCLATVSVWRGRGGRLECVCSSLALGLGVLMIVPGFGEKLLAMGRMDPSVFDPGRYQVKMLATAVLTIALAVFAYGSVAGRIAGRERCMIALLTVSCGAFLMTLPWSEFLWKTAPSLSASIQFPHRFCGILTVACVGLLAPAIDCSIGAYGTSCQRSHPPALLALLVLIVIGAGILAWRPDQLWRRGLQGGSVYETDAARELDAMYRTYVPYRDLDSFAALVGTQPSSYDVGRTSLVDGSAVLIQGRGTIESRWQNFRTVTIIYDAPEGGIARINQLYSPLWKIEPTNDAMGDPAPGSSPEGLIEFPLNPGSHELTLDFDLGWPERFGWLITFTSIGLVFASALIELAPLHSGRISRIWAAR
jgi:hypothetical protein